MSLRINALLMALGVCVACFAGIGLVLAQTGGLEAAIHDRVNAVRQAQGLAPLDYNEDLAELARDHSRYMASTGELSHTGRAGRRLTERMEHAGIPYRRAAENLFSGTNLEAPAERAVSGWMASESHRENLLLDDITEAGVGVYRRDDTVYVTQIYRRPDVHAGSIEGPRISP